MLSLCLHEFSHAAVAYLGGDTSVREKGYLTFNPLKYTHPFYSLVLPLIFLALGGIGLPGGAVYIETWRLRSRRWISAVSLAGPLANLLVAVIIGILLALPGIANSSLAPALAFLAYLQVYAVVLNLIPLPPFDGFGAIEPYLDSGLRANLAVVRQYLPWVVFILLWNVPVVGRAIALLVQIIASLLRIPSQAVFAGMQQFFFWQN